MYHKVEKVNRTEYQEIVDVWEASVRATHHFLKEGDIAYFKPLILNTYLDAVELRCIKDSNQRIAGFSGVATHSLEMLFIHPDHRGKKLGEQLLSYSIQQMNVCKVDVNEQNEQAVGFYHHFGFETIGRSEVDATGKPYPVLRMELKS